MASVKVAVRVRPFNKREIDMDCKFIIQMHGKKTTITNIKMQEHAGDHTREINKDFSYDFSYWTVDKNESRYASQEEVFQDLGVDVIKSAYEGYNACVFAYGQTGSGKTYSMMGNPGDVGLIPRICQGLFAKMTDQSMTYRTEVSYLEIYNEKVRDLLKSNSSKTQHSLRVREHPKEGPYVQDLSKHIVQNFEDIKELMDKGNFSRTTASTNMNDVSSRSHAIFTIVFTQAKFSNDAPSETHSKIHLVDLAGSERADATGATGIRLKEGGSINKSLVTLGNVISALADISDKSASRKSTAFIPYRDSVLTWLLKDSLGGNSKTMMIAAISPADCNYAETLSTLRYANRAKNIINKPTVNEDGNVKIIRELREEISRLRMMLGGNIDLPTIPRVQEKLHENEARVKVLTEEWAGKWKEAANILKEDSTLALRKEGMGVILDSELPHLIGIDDDILSTGIMLYHLKEGKTRIGTAEAKDNLDIILQGLEMETEHCVIEHTTGEVVLVPQNDAQCMVNGNVVSDPTPLSQGAVILLGKTNMFRFNHPQQAQKLREEFKGSTRNLSASRMSLLSQSMSDLCRSTESLALATSGWEMEQKHIEQLEALEEKRQEIEDMEEKFRQAEQVRISEQSSKESELENKRLTLEDMQKKAEQIKHEAEKAQIEAKKENAKLKRRSMDIEKQMKEYIEEKEKFHVEREQERNAKLQQKDSEDRMIERYREEKSDMRKMIEEEMAALMTKEREHVEIAQGTKEKLLEELERLQQEHHQQRQHFEDSWKTLSQKEMEYEVKVQKASGNGSDHDILECEMEEELAKIDGERLQLENLRDDHQLFDKVISDLSTGTKEALAAERIKLSNFYDEVLKKEKHFYERYVAQKDGASSARSQEETDIADKHEQLAADRIYIEDCENNYVKSVSETASLTPDARDQLEREKLAIEIEKERIAEDEEGLNDRKSKVQGTFDALLQEIEIQRSCDIDNLNKERQKLKDCKVQWHNVVEQEIERSVEKRTKVMQEFEEREKGASDNDNGIELISALEEQKTDLIGERKALEDKQRDSENEARRSISKINRMSTELDEKTKREIEKISTRMKALVELEAWESTKPTEYSIKQRQAAFEKYRTLKDEKSLEELLRVVEDELSCENSTLGGKGRETLEMERELLKTRMKDLHQLEDQLSKSEDELHSKRREFEDQRQKELDKIEVEKFNLQEMEHEERINALVEQEVKRRLLEERVQREKKRRMEREQDKVEREQEMFKLKKAHQKEIKRIKQFYENRDNSSVISENVPTRANPYASTLSGESMSRGGGNNSMVRAHSTPSLQTNSVANPIHVSLPSHMIRGSGFDSHVEFEVKLSVYNESWTVFRRYTKFRDLHLELKNKYPEVSALVFPPKKWFGNKSEKVIFERRLQLESYLCAIVEALYRRSNSPLHPSNAQYYSKQLLTDFHPFFKKGMFESSKYATS